jgi:DNA (cytosine-5)-methyltransferase 1
VVLSDNERAVLNSKKHTVVVLDPDRPSHTLTTLPDDILHYNEPRILTVREYARLQSFPDWFVFKGKYTTGGEKRRNECPRYTQVGNAVAPLVAQILGIAIARFLCELGLSRTEISRGAEMSSRERLLERC